MPRVFGSILLFGSSVCEKRLKPNRVSSSVRLDNGRVPDDANQRRGRRIADRVEHVDRAVRRNNLAAVAAGADWKLLPQKTRSLSRLFAFSW
jgi:hypothetical protein